MVSCFRDFIWVASYFGVKLSGSNVNEVGKYCIEGAYVIHTELDRKSDFKIIFKAHTFI